MLTDHWIIVQLLAQVSAFALLLVAAVQATAIVWGWQASSLSEGQLLLERKTYLVSSITQLVLLFQVVSLLMFLVTVNEHLPGVIKGAMCATGTLTTNAFGYPLLFLKMFAVLVYVTFLILNYYDEAEPAYPLTPRKYLLIYPSLLLVGGELVLSILFFANISPDIIATCCSVSFIGSGKESFSVLNASGGPWLAIGFVASGILFFILMFSKPNARVATLISGLLFTLLGVLSLKAYFVKYIYGLPTHLCLFDIFFPQYHYIGYLIFGAYYTLVVALLVPYLWQTQATKLNEKHQTLRQRARLTAFVAAGFCLFIPLAYWAAWPGSL